MYLCHSFFNRSSVDGHLGGFCVLGIVNSAAVNIGTHVSFSIMVSSGYMPSSEIVGSYGSLIPSFFLRNFHTGSLPYWFYQFTFPPTVQERSLFSTPPPAFIVCRLFDDGHADWCERKTHCGFDLYLSNNKRC